jgi:phosphoribosyl 1,2-cyclic phosphodiesterase
MGNPPLSFRFWGVRGSLPSAGIGTARYGGNTPCLEVRAADQLFIVDLGSGLRLFGEFLGAGPHQATLLLTHYHYDHVQGLPFFAPMYDARSSFEIYGPAYEGQGVKQVLAGQMVPPYFPVGLEVIRAQVGFQGIGPGQTLRFGEATLKTELLNHPGGSLGYRFEAGGRSLVYCTDAEPDGGDWDARMTAFARGADTVIIDAMYTPDELAGRGTHPRRGFGHGTWESAVAAARAANARKLVLCHHDPARNDDQIEALVKLARVGFPQTSAAREGERVEV